jgi:hypothetical protein
MIYIVPIEPIDARYTKQWYDNIPKIIEDAGGDVVTIDGCVTTGTVTRGAFLDFGATNAYKASQVENIANLFTSGLVVAGDKFLVTDAWNFAITAIRYMSELLDIPVEIHSIWHAGNYDPTDILGMKMGKWAHHQETAWFHASDFNYFATDFHRYMFLDNLDIPKGYDNKAIRSGQPHSPLIEQLSPMFDNKKNDLVLFPHRLNSDKQPEIATDLAGLISAQIIQNQKLQLSKDEYYAMLGTARAVFSCSLHENLGISMMEGVLAGAIPIVPDRASYSEMYLDCFKYPSVWTESYDNYLVYRDKLIFFINQLINNYDDFKEPLKIQRDILIKEFLEPTIMVNNLLDKND